MEPSKYFQQHHAVDAPIVNFGNFRPFWRVRTRLDVLLLQNVIDFRIYYAAIYFRNLVEMGVAEQWRNTDLAGGARHSGPADSVVEHRIDARDRLRNIRKRLPQRRDFSLLEALIVEGLSFAKIGRRFRVHATTARRWSVAALRSLAMAIANG